MARKGVLQDERGFQVYPITKSSCVYMNNDKTVEETIAGSNMAYFNDVLPNPEAVPINADTLNGLKADQLPLNMDLLWENASPSAAFEPQTLDIASAGYSMLLVTFAQSIAHLDRIYSLQILPVDGYAELYWARSFIQIRFCQTAANKMTFFDSAYWSTWNVNSTFTKDNTSQIPLKIFGIK